MPRALYNPATHVKRDTLTRLHDFHPPSPTTRAAERQHRHRQFAIALEQRFILRDVDRNIPVILKA